MDKLCRGCQHLQEQLLEDGDSSQISCNHLEEVVAASALKSPKDFLPSDYFAINAKEKKSRKSLKRSKEFISLTDIDKNSKEQ